MGWLWQLPLPISAFWFGKRIERKHFNPFLTHKMLGPGLIFEAMRTITFTPIHTQVIPRRTAMAASMFLAWWGCFVTSPFCKCVLKLSWTTSLKGPVHSNVIIYCGGIFYFIFLNDLSGTLGNLVAPKFSTLPYFYGQSLFCWDFFFISINLNTLMKRQNAILKEVVKLLLKRKNLFASWSGRSDQNLFLVYGRK